MTSYKSWAQSFAEEEAVKAAEGLAAGRPYWMWALSFPALRGLGRVLCHACNWNVEFEEGSWYQSNIKIKYASKKAAGIWSVGDKYVLREGPISNPHSAQYSINVDYLRKTTNIPVPKIILSWVDDQNEYMFMERVPGTTLARIWEDISPEVQERYMKEIVGYLDQLRKLTAPGPSTVDGKPLRDTIFNNGDIPDFKEEFFRYFIGSEALREECLRCFPAMEPFTFTHIGLHPSKIMVNDGHITGILGWESAGYYPVWWQCMETERAFDSMKGSFYGRLREEMEQHREAWLYIRKYRHLFPGPPVPHVTPATRPQRKNHKVVQVPRNGYVYTRMLASDDDDLLFH